MTLRVVDPHIHLWDLSTGLYPGLEKPSIGYSGNNAPIARSYLRDEYLAEGGSDVVVEAAVHVEAFPTDRIKEAETIEAVAAASPVPLALVANADLSSPDVARDLERLSTFKTFRGIRQVLNRHTNAAYNYVPRDFMHEPAWQAGFGLLVKHRASFDLQLYPHQVADAAALAGTHPGTAIIINHALMWADRNLAGWVQWKAALRAMAAHSNVSVKISGLGMLDQKWTVESIRPLVLESIEVFGVSRAMFASNFPVDKLYSTFPALWQAFDAVTVDFTGAERAALFRDNARRTYRLQPERP